MRALRSDAPVPDPALRLGTAFEKSSRDLQFVLVHLVVAGFKVVATNLRASASGSSICGRTRSSKSWLPRRANASPERSS
jgi:hypothetical protein